MKNHALTFLRTLSNIPKPSSNSSLAKWTRVTRYLCHTALVENQSCFTIPSAETIAASLPLTTIPSQPSEGNSRISNFCSQALRKLSRYLPCRCVISCKSGNYNQCIAFAIPFFSFLLFFSFSPQLRQLSSAGSGTERFRGLICPTCFHPSSRRVTVARNYANEIVFANGTRSSKGNYSRAGGRRGFERASLSLDEVSIREGGNYDR